MTTAGTMSISTSPALATAITTIPQSLEIPQRSAPTLSNTIDPQQQPCSLPSLDQQPTMVNSGVLQNPSNLYTSDGQSLGGVYAMEG
ncbi:hypothetical protein BGX24_004101, partial [Mortierella sp. AD032]